MPDVAIRINNLSQLYRIGPLGETAPQTAVFPFGVRECCSPRVFVLTADVGV